MQVSAVAAQPNAAHGISRWTIPLTLQGADRAAGTMVYLKGPLNAVQIIGVYPRRRLRIDGRQVGVERGRPRQSGARANGPAELRIGGRAIEEPINECHEVKRGA